MNNIPQFETEIYNLFAATSNIDAATKTKLRNRFVSAYPNDFVAYLETNQVSDTAANRGKFLVSKLSFYMKDVYTSEHDKEQRAALPPPEKFE